MKICAVDRAVAEAWVDNWNPKINCENRDDDDDDDDDGYNTDEEGLFEHEDYLVSEPWDV